MRQKQLNRVLNLIRRTGERCVIADNESDAVMVLMGLEEYENLSHSNASIEKLNEEELLDKINRDIALWRSRHREQSLEDYQMMDDDEEEDEVEDEEREFESFPDIDEAASARSLESAPFEQADTEAFSWSAPFSEENLNDLPEGTEEEEEKFYLEPIE